MRIIDWSSDVCSSDLGRGITSVLIVVVALIGWEMLSATIERYLDAKDAEGNRVERSQRMRTLLPLVRNFAFIVLAALVLLTVLSEAGPDLPPPLTGAGLRTAARRGGTAWVRTCRYRGGPNQQK